MADQKVTQLTENTSPIITDIVPMVDDPAGIPATQKVTIQNLLLLAYPIGTIYQSVVSTSPATLFGGTWSAFGAGKMLVGLDLGDTDFDVVEETGGAKTKTIAQANLPNISTGAGTAHTHIQDAHNHTQDAHSHTQRYHSATTGGLSGPTTAPDTSSNTPTNYGITTATTVATNQATTATNQNESAHTHSLGGSGTALNVMNPYIIIYRWKRTA